MFNMYAIRDLNLGYNQPYCEKNDEVAIRGFSYAINHNDIMGFRPSDFLLFKVGEYDDEKGDVIGEMPVLICRGEDVFAHD